MKCNSSLCVAELARLMAMNTLCYQKYAVDSYLPELFFLR